MNNMIIRALSGTVYVGLIIASILSGNVYFGLLMALFIIVGIIELQNVLSLKSKINPIARVWDIIVAMAVIYGSFDDCIDGVLTILPITVLIFYIPVRMIIAVVDKTDNPTASICYSIFSLMYVCVPLMLLFQTYNISWQLVLVTFVMIWMNDTGAYLSGVTMGRHKMCERLSPKKTWEGFAGGFLACVAVGIGYSLIFAEGENLIVWGIYAALVSIVSTYGDLFESMIKRYVGVKDSGNIIPGHGGILDRIDSLLAVAPITLIMALIIK